MGASKSREIPPLGADTVTPPDWASKLTPSSTSTVFFDIEINSSPIGRIEMTLASTVYYIFMRI